MKRFYTVSVFLFIVGVVLLSGCRSPISVVEPAFTTVHIDVGGITDSRGVARAVPQNVASFKLTITAEGMDTIEKTFTGSSVTLEVLAGSARTFTLIAYDADGVKLYSGSKTVDLVA